MSCLRTGAHSCILVLAQGLKHNKCWTLSFPPVLCGFLLHDRLSPEVACLLSPAPSLPLYHLLALSSHIVQDIPSSDSYPGASSGGEIALFWASTATCLQLTSHRYNAFFSVILLSDPFLPAVNSCGQRPCSTWCAQDPTFPPFSK